MSQMHEASELVFDLTDRLYKSLRISGMNANSLGAALGVHRNTINNYLHGRSRMDRRTLIAWAFATGVPVEWLERGIDPSTGGDDGGGTEADGRTGFGVPGSNPNGSARVISLHRAA